MRSRRADRILLGLLGAVSYLPLFLSRPGMVAADTKQYLYLDPGRLTAGAASMWDPNTGLGTVTHQNIGYLLPMGPYYSLIGWLGVPMWVGQRIWMGSLMLAAGTGVAYCARKLGLEGPGRAVAALAYTLSPYILDYLDRISAILMPWAALGWLIGLTVAAARTGRRRYPALFALVVAVVGGVNATSILLVLVAPAVWLAHAAWVSREITGRRAVRTVLTLAALSLLVSLWWAAGLWAEGRYGINILRVTETVPTVSRSSSASEVLRGLGYWYFYGWDKVQPWTLQAVPYTQSPWLLAVSFLLPGIAVLLGLVARWTYRSFCLALIGVGTAVAVGAFPFTDPSLFGAVIKGASAGSTLALAMRSVDRIVPLVVLGLALLMGSGLTGLRLRRPGWGLAAAGLCSGLVAANLPALWTGGLIAANLSRPSRLPTYWTAAASYLNSLGSSTRVLGLPGEDFGAYSWGVTQDPVPPGLLDRSYVSRQVVPAGSPASANLLQALDEPIQEGTFDPAALAPVARLMSVGQILLQSDLQYERYHLPLPQVLYRELVPPPAGISGPRAFGAPDPAPVIRYPLDSEARLGIPTGTPQPPALAVFNVSDPRPLVRAEDAGAPLVIAGDGAGVVEAAGAGLLAGNPTILYAATRQSVPAGATLVVTDTNPLANYRWGSLRDNVGQVQQPGAPGLSPSPSDYTLPVFPGQTPADQTVLQVSGLKSVQASTYGDSLTFTPENAPLNAFDGDPHTAWTFGAHASVTGVRIQAGLLHPVTADHVVLTQAVFRGQVKRHITSVTLLFDGGKPVTVPLTAASLTPAGQTVSFPARTFSRFELVVDGATGGADKRFDGLPPVGFSSITIPGVPAAHGSLRLPTDLLAATGAASQQHPLDILMQRSRAPEQPRHDPEPAMSRTFSLPTARTFSVAGTAEINAGDSDYLINQLVGLTPQGPVPAAAPAPSPGPATIVAANSSTRLDGDRNARANQAVDGNPATAWVAETGPQAGEWLRVWTDKPISFDHLDLRVVNDGRHSLPSRITISTGSGTRTVDVPVPPVGTGRPQGSTSLVPVSFPALSGRSVQVTVDAVHQVRVPDYFSTFAGLTDELPVGIAELGLPGVVQPAAPPGVPAVCSPGLLQIDGRPIDVEVTGSTSAALAGSQIALRPCGNSANGVALGPGTHTVQTSPRLPLGWSIDQLRLESQAGGAPTTPTAVTTAAVDRPAPATVRVDGQNRTGMTVTVDRDGRPMWLVLGQSFNAGWSATTAGGRSLGAAHLVDGFANGWYLPAGPPGPLVVHLRWTPQTLVWAALGVSGAAVVGCLLAVAVPETVALRRRRRPGPDGGARPGARLPVAADLGPQPASLAALLALPSGPGAGARPVASRLVVAAAAWGLLTAFFTRPSIGAVAAAAALAAGWWRPGRAVCRIAAVVALLALAGYAVEQQVAYRYWPTIDWPADLSSANDLAWLGLALLGSDLVGAAARLRAGGRSTLATAWRRHGDGGRPGRRFGGGRGPRASRGGGGGRLGASIRRRLRAREAGAGHAAPDTPPPG
ncbi:MAG TPA: alpha-(1-_3)-arabinofuranosyltransferase family protein [Acidimicrobiales bacterium]|nr:alpha-(1->3)-arabinofuranosyltransferase family protein [Acidimicrobiales bacterium]